MDFTIANSEHTAAVQAAASVLPTRTTLPSLSTLHIQAHADGRITYRGTDLDTAVEVTLAGDVKTPGAVCLHGKTLMEIARETENGEIQVTATPEGHAQIKAKNTRYRLEGISPETFGAAPAVRWTAPVQLEAALFAALAEPVAWAASKEDNKPALQGVYLHRVGKALRAVATNGHQLALAEIPLPALPEGDGWILRPEALLTAAKLMASRGPVEISLEETTVGIRAAGIQMTTRLLEGPYVDYRRVLPQQATTTAVLPTAELVRAIRQVAPVASDHKNHTTALNAGGGQIALWTEASSVGKAQNAVAATVEGDDITIGINAALLAQVLKHTAGDDVRLRFAGAQRPILIDARGAGGAVRSLYLVSPLSLDAVPWAADMPRSLRAPSSAVKAPAEAPALAIAA